MEIEIDGKKYEIRELTADEMMDVLGDGAKQTKQLNKEIISICIGMPINEVGKMSAKIFFPLLKKCNEINGISQDFQQAKVN